MKYLNMIADLIIYLFVVFTLWTLVQIFIFNSFRIASNSMSPTLMKGDVVVVNKLLMGARLFHPTSFAKANNISVFRVKGLTKIMRNDVLVFNVIHPNTNNFIELDMTKFCIKRCIGIPGDTIRILNGFFKVNESNTLLGNLQSQLNISNSNFSNNVHKSFPQDSILNWDIKNFGPLYLPQNGDIININRKNYFLYHKLIEWEQMKSIKPTDKGFIMDDEEYKNYKFTKNYYFVAGDNGLNSEDSRYWGLLPEEYIVGKATVVLKPKDKIVKFIH